MQFVDRRPDVIRSIQHRWLLKYWDGLRSGRALPAWGRLDPQEIARVVDRVVIFDVVHGEAGPRFRIRFQGAQITQAYGADCSGKFLDETQPASTRDSTLAIYRHATKAARPLYTIAETRDRGDRLVDHERLMLPFGPDGRTVRRILTLLETVSTERRFEQTSLLASSPGLHYSLLAAIDLRPDIPAVAADSASKTPPPAIP